MILIITNKDDIHPNPVINKLNNFPFLRINSEDLLKKYKIFWKNKNGEISWSIINNDNEIIISSDNVKSVWERRPLKPKSLPILSKDRKINSFCRDEGVAFFQNFRYFLKDIFYLGDPLVDRSARSRMLQHQIATKLKMRCTNSIYSNSAEEIKNFAKNYNFLYLKPIHVDYLNYEDYYLSLGSIKTSQNEILNLNNNSLEATINYIQEYVEKDYELRITVVCNKVFACKLYSQELDESNGKVDWRDGLDSGLRHEKCEVPRFVEIFCIEYLKEMNQHFGAFDFIVTPKGEYVFLECNSNGQWYWIELETGLNISGAIAEHLIKGSW